MRDRKMKSNDPLTYRFEEDGNRVTISMEGRLDSVTSPEFQTAAVAKCGGKDVIVDMSGLTYLSSAGLRAVLALDRASGSMRISHASGPVKDVLDMSGFGSFLMPES